MLIVALGHRRNTGKDTIADALCAELGLRKVSFANKLKDTAHDLFGWAGVKPRQWYEDNYYHKNEYLEKLDMTYRDLLIQLGNLMRGINENVWIRSAIPTMADLESTGHRGIVIADCRYPNEADYVLDCGGLALRVQRDVEEFDDVADSALVGYGRWTAIYINDHATKEALQDHVRERLAPFVLEAFRGN